MLSKALAKSAVLGVIAILGLIFANQSRAQVPATSTWDGGAPDDFWLTPANWNGDAAPLAGNQLVFAGAVRLTPNNNFANGTLFSNINFDSTAGGFTVSGNGLTLNSYRTNPAGLVTAGSISNSSTSAQTIALPLTMSRGSHAIFTTAGSGGAEPERAFTRAAGSYVLFGQVGATPGAINLSGTGLSNTNGILGGWAGYTTLAITPATANSLNPVGWAALDGSGNVIPLANAGYTEVTAGSAITSAAATNVKVTTSGTANTLAAAGTTDINSLLLINTAANQTINISATQTLRLGAGGIMNSSDALGTVRNFTIGQTAGQGFLTAGGADNTAGELFLINTGLNAITGNNLTINSAIVNNGTGRRKCCVRRLCRTERHR